MKIPFVNLKNQRDAYREELNEACERVYESGNFIGGNEVEKLEQTLSDYTQAPYVVTCASGTSAITLALLALDLQAHDEVIVPDFSFIAPAECVALCGGVPRFADVDPDTFLIDPVSVTSLINSKTKGIIAVNLFGQCAPYIELQKIADKNNLWLLEDAAQSFGAKQNRVRSARLARFAVTSFYPTKPLGCYGDGGAFFSTDKQIAERVRLLANHGSNFRYKHREIGLNSRLDALQAAVLHVKLKHLDEELEKRRQNAEHYNAFFSKFSEIQTPIIFPGNESSYAQYTLKISNRLQWEAILEHAQIPYCIHYPLPLSEQLCFSNLPQNHKLTQNTKNICQEVLSLPICAFTDINTIIQKIETI